MLQKRFLFRAGIELAIDVVGVYKSYKIVRSIGRRIRSDKFKSSNYAHYLAERNECDAHN